MTRKNRRIRRRIIQLVNKQSLNLGAVRFGYRLTMVLVIVCVLLGMFISAALPGTTNMAASTITTKVGMHWNGESTGDKPEVADRDKTGTTPPLGRVP